jgi:hypothetical protein
MEKIRAAKLNGFTAIINKPRYLLSKIITLQTQMVSNKYTEEPP